MKKDWVSHFLIFTEILGAVRGEEEEIWQILQKGNEMYSVFGQLGEFRGLREESGSWSLPHPIVQAQFVGVPPNFIKVYPSVGGQGPPWFITRPADKTRPHTSVNLTRRPSNQSNCLPRGTQDDPASQYLHQDNQVKFQLINKLTLDSSFDWIWN